METAVFATIENLFRVYGREQTQASQLKRCILDSLSLIYESFEPEKKAKRVYIDGCFDLMHSGHYNALRQAKQLGHTLVVGVHSCEEILKNKGPTVMTDEERLAVVKSCKWVDEVVFDVPYSPTLELLDRLNCDFCVHGDDMPTNSSGKSAYEEVLKAGRCKIIKRTEGISTTTLVGRLLLLSSSPSPSSSSSSTSTSSSSKVAVQENGESPSQLSSFLPTLHRLCQFSKFSDKNYNRKDKNAEKVVYVAGCFDLFHAAHIDILEQSKSKGDFLLVGVYDDNTVQRIRGRNHPIMTLYERVLNVLACKLVDEVILGTPFELTAEMINTLHIKVVVGFNEFQHTQVDPFIAAKQQHIFTEVKSSKDLSAEVLVDRLLSNKGKFQEVYERKKKKQDEYEHQSMEWRRQMHEL